MLLQDLPKKTLYHLLKSVTWSEVERAVPIKHRLRRFIRRVARTKSWVMRIRRRTLNHGVADERPKTQELDERNAAA
jgi:hypothetical protein